MEVILCLVRLLLLRLLAVAVAVPIHNLLRVAREPLAVLAVAVAEETEALPILVALVIHHPLHHRKEIVAEMGKIQMATLTTLAVVVERVGRVKMHKQRPVFLVMVAQG
jgi:hypothetical protein